MEEARISDMAASLYSGGWRAEDKDQMIQEYDLTEQDAERIAKKLEEIAAEYVTNEYGVEILFDVAVELMDDDIREDLHAKGYDTNQAFFDAYCKAHAEKYEEDFELAKANPTY